MVTLDMSMSLDGFITGPNVRPDEPLGDGGSALDQWASAGNKQDCKLLADAAANLGSAIAGRRTYDFFVESWGPDGPSGSDRRPVFVVTRRAPKDAPEGGVYTFVTDGIEAALQAAQAAADGKDVVIMGGASIAQQYLRAGLIDDVSIHLAPVIFGDGTRLFEDLGEAQMQLKPHNVIQTAAATHLTWHVAHGAGTHGSKG
jgi:dihydrofolate reductase